MIDVSDAAWSLLNSVSALVTAAPGGIYGEPGLPQGWTPDSGETLVFVADSFPADESLPIINQTFQVRFYAKDVQRARALQSVFYDNFHRRKNQSFSSSQGTVLLCHSHVLNGNRWMVEPDTEWGFVMATWQAEFGENTL